jgi:hypothetical protein
VGLSPIFIWAREDGGKSINEKIKISDMIAQSGTDALKLDL